MPSALFTRFIVVLFMIAGSAHAFHVQPSRSSTTTTSSALNIFGNLKDAFANEDMGTKQNAGLTKGPEYNDNVTVNGKPVKGAVVGQKLTVVAGRARVKIPVNCQKGDCGTCIVNVNGRKAKACQTTLGKGKTTIQTL